MAKTTKNYNWLHAKTELKDFFGNGNYLKRKLDFLSFSETEAGKDYHWIYLF